jgi:hypothetical protein
MVRPFHRRLRSGPPGNGRRNPAVFAGAPRPVSDGGFVAGSRRALTAIKRRRLGPLALATTRAGFGGRGTPTKLGVLEVGASKGPPRGQSADSGGSDVFVAIRVVRRACSWIHRGGEL